MKRNYGIIRKVAAAVCALGMMTGTAWGQYSDYRIKHKAGQWYDTGRGSYQSTYPRTERDPNNPYAEGMDTFDDTGGLDNKGYQKTHEYIEYIYTNPDRTITFWMPSQESTAGNNAFNYKTYQRWYNYETDENVNNLSAVGATGYRFSNGLVGGNFISNGGRNPYSDNFNAQVWKVQYQVPLNFEEIQIACDASRYGDAELESSNYGGTLTEPTLSTRCIFIIRNAGEIKQEIANKTREGKYLEEYEIHYPTERLNAYTPEVVALSMNARNYFVERDYGANAGELTVTAEGNIDINIDRNNPDRWNRVTLSGEERIIFFNYTTRSDGERATITVKNGNYNVARFTIIFDDNTKGLTESEVEKIERIGENENNPSYTRTNDFFERNYINLNTMDFEYVQTTSGLYGKDYYPYPINWGYNTYGFFANQDNRADRNPDLPQSAEYAIMQGFSESNNSDEDIPWGQELDGSDYHLYVDASDKPGTIAKVPFRQPLCAGAMMYVTAWIKNQGWGGSGTDDAGLVFILKGVKGGVEQEIYRHASGQIPRVSTRTSYWHQIYFSYPNGNTIYDSYLLQIDNNCASSRGGDIALDDIRIYMNPLSVNAYTTEPVCKDDVMAKVRLELHYDLLLGRVGLTNETSSENIKSTTAYYCFLDKEIYDETYTGSNYSEAFNKALVQGSGVYTGGGSQYGTFTFYNNTNRNDGSTGVASMDESEENIIFNSEIQGNLDNEMSYLHSGKSYYILLLTALDPNSDLALQFDKEDICTTQGAFQVQGQLIIKGDGTADIESSIPCIGEIPVITAEMRNSNGEIIPSVNFDWYFGTEDDFYNETVEGQEGRTLYDALEAFRHFYPTARMITTEIITEVGESKSDESYTLYKEDLDLLKELNEDFSAGGEQPKLALTASKDLNIHLLQAETPVVVIPISDIDVDESEKTCWDPTGIVLKATGNAPILSAGFDGQNNIYPDDGEKFVSIRLNKAHADALQNGRALNIRLRDPKRINEDGSEEAVRLALIENDHILYLGGTSDPDYMNLVEDGLSYPIGTISYFNASPAGDGETNIMRVSLYKKTDEQGINVKEGHYYTLNFRYQIDGASTEGSCNIGNLTIPMLIVPEYLVWTGNANENWNNDGNWRRATANELKKDNNYPTITGGQGYAPLNICKIIIPKGSKIQLYQPGLKTPTNFLDLETTAPQNMNAATPYIEYDMVVGGKPTGTDPMTCYRYYTNRINQIHFEPNTEMLHTELLTYEKAWVDYELEKGRWYTLASPLQGVVAGDFYADQATGREAQEYFTPISFDGNNTYNNDNVKNDRFNPSVYQRGWKGSATLQTLNDGPKNVAIEGNWSSVYNDVTVPYSEGTGFSLKVQDITADKALFRLPKADGSYTYYNSDGSTASTPQTETITRTGTVHKLYTGQVDVNLNEAQDGTHYLVGNPYMAHIDATEFFKQNTGLLEKYWLVDEAGQKVAVGSEITTSSDNTIAPLQSFFVAINEEVTTKPTKVTFTTSMQTLGTDVNDNLRSTDILYLTATTPDGKQSRAALAYNLAADKEYEASEDAELFLDSNLSDVPTVYTVAGTMATSINQTSELYNIPVGVYCAGATNENVSLSFSNLNGFSYATLYDAETGTDTPLHEGSSFSIPANTNGRYFLRAGVPTANEAVQENAIRIYSVGGQLVIASTDLLQQVYIYDFAGRLVDSETRLHTTRYTTDLPAGNYMVKARSVSGEKIEKFKLRN